MSILPNTQVRKFVVSAMADTALGRDRFVNTVHLGYEPIATGHDWDGDCAAIMDVFRSVIYADSREIDVKAYVVGTTGPHFPIGHAVSNTGTTVASSMPREVALCLSYYGERNLPRTRGRLYLPVAAFQAGAGLRPTTTAGSRLLDLGSALSGIGGADVDWVVYSPTAGNAEKVQHCWVDDEWDTIRSRGLRATTRWTRDVSG